LPRKEKRKRKFKPSVSTERKDSTNLKTQLVKKSKIQKSNPRKKTKPCKS